MLPFVLAAVGGYLVYDSMKSEKFAKGGGVSQNTPMGIAKMLYNKYDKKERKEFLISAGYSDSVSNDLSMESWDSLEKQVHTNLAKVLQSGKRKTYGTYADGGETKGAKDAWDNGKPIKKVKWVTYALYKNELGYTPEESVELTYKKWDELTKDVQRALVSVMPENFEDGGMMADGGEVDKLRNDIIKLEDYISKLKDVEKYEKEDEEKVITNKETRIFFENKLEKLKKRLEELESDGGKMAKGGETEEMSMKKGIRRYYMRAFPDDDMGADINPKATFKGLLKTLEDKKNVYNYLGVEDSLVRERVFGELAEIMRVKYSKIYDMWLLGDDD